MYVARVSIQICYGVSLGADPPHLANHKPAFFSLPPSTEKMNKSLQADKKAR